VNEIIFHKMKELTKAEEQVMHILWDIEKGFIKDIILHMEEPKPAYNTVSTIVRILETKGFVSHKEYGKSHRYFSIVKKNYFGNSASQVVSFFAKNKKMDVREVDEIIRMLQDLKGKTHE
jgi:BlaI family penicillinase repressor